MGAATASLRDGLEHRRKWSLDHIFFFSKADIDSLFTREAISAALADSVSDEVENDDISSTIFDKGRKTFAILLWNYKVEFITSFIEHGALDDDLPLDETRARGIVLAFGRSFALDWQWHFIPFILKHDMRLHHRVLRREWILPFVHQEKIGEGAFGEVFLTAVDSSQQTLTDPAAMQAAEDGTFIPDLQVVQMEIGEDQIPHSVVRIVRKQFVLRNGHTEESRDRMVENERACLNALGRLKHQNIIQMLGCYAYRDERSILFPHIEMDLEEFLQLPHRFGDFIHDYTFFYALQGLASALACVHNLKLTINGIELERIGYHHDFRPKNVLVNTRTFLLADFGLSKIKPVEDGSRTIWKAGPPNYLAPECTDMGSCPQEVGRAIDMWAFGCMVAEIVTYMKDGPDGIARFRQNRTSQNPNPRIEDQCFHNGHELKPAVRDWFRTLLGKPFSTYAANLVDLSKSMLVVEVDKRLKCPELCKRLNFLCAKSDFTLVLEALNRLIEQMEATPEPPEGPPIMELRLERELLQAWAAAFGLTGHATWLSGFDKAEIGEKHVESLRLVFRKMLNRVHLELNKYNSDPDHTDARELIALDIPVLEVIRGLVQDLRKLLETGKVEVNLKDSDGRTPLSWAAQNGQEPVVKQLLKAGKIDVNLKDSNSGRTPLLWAAGKGHEAIVKLLLETGKVEVNLKDSDGQTPLWWAAANGHEAVVKLLLKMGKVEDSDKSPLWCALGNGHEATVKLLLEMGKIDVNLKDSCGRTPLLLAAGKGQKAIVKLLLETGKVEVNLKDSDGQTPLWWAAANGHKAVVKLLLTMDKVDLKDSDKSPLWCAAGNRHEAIVKLLLETGKVDVNLKDSDGRTLLLLAAGKGHKAIVNLLLETGKAEVNLKDSNGRTPLWWAEAHGHEAVVKLLKLHHNVS